MPSIPLSQVMVLLVVLLVVCVIWVVDGVEIQREWRAAGLRAGEWRRTRRALRPRGADSCERCCAEGEPKGCPTRGALVAWEHYKQQTGRHKAYDSDGVFCPNAACRFDEVSDGQIHAIVHDGWRGKRKDIPVGLKNFICHLFDPFANSGQFKTDPRITISQNLSEDRY